MLGLSLGSCCCQGQDADLALSRLIFFFLLTRRERQRYSGHDADGGGAAACTLTCTLGWWKKSCGVGLSAWNSFRREKCVLFSILFPSFASSFSLTFEVVCRGTEGRGGHVDLVGLDGAERKGHCSSFRVATKGRHTIFFLRIGFVLASRRFDFLCWGVMGWIGMGREEGVGWHSR